MYKRQVLTDMTLALRQLRDLAFAVVGPRNYESVSSLGFVVQSDATQNGSSGSFNSDSSGDSPSDPPVSFSAGDLVEYLDDPAVTVDSLLGVESDQLLTRDQWINLIVSSELSSAEAAGNAFDGLEADHNDES